MVMAEVDPPRLGDLAEPDLACHRRAGEGEKKDQDEDEGADDGDEETVDLNKATFEQLRDIGCSVTQATRLLTYRERQGGFDSIDDLKDVPGMPEEFLTSVRSKLRVG